MLPYVHRCKWEGPITEFVLYLGALLCLQANNSQFITNCQIYIWAMMRVVFQTLFTNRCQQSLQLLSWGSLPFEMCLKNCKAWQRLQKFEEKEFPDSRALCSLEIEDTIWLGEMHTKTRNMIQTLLQTSLFSYTTNIWANRAVDTYMTVTVQYITVQTLCICCLVFRLHIWHEALEETYPSTGAWIKKCPE